MARRFPVPCRSLMPSCDEASEYHTHRGHPFVNRAGVLPRAHVVGVIDPARECIVVDRTHASLGSGQKAGSHVAGDLELDWTARLLLNDDCTDPNFRPDRKS